MSSEFVKDLEHKVVIITGSSSGIGEAVATLFAKIGSKVVITGRNAEKVDKVAAKCESLSPFQYKPLRVIGDLTNDETVKHLVSKTIENFKSIDCLVTSAGVSSSDLWATLSDEELMRKYDVIMRLDVRSVLLLCQLCLPYLVQSKGSVVTISSINSTKPYVGMLLHGMSKAAIDMLTKTMALEFGAKGVRVNSVNPGAIYTPLWDMFGLSKEQLEAEKEKAAQATVLNRVGEPEDVAKFVVFLASNASSYVTGTNMLIDGGFVCK